MRWLMAGAAVAVGLAMGACGGDPADEGLDVDPEQFAATLSPDAVVGTDVVSDGSGSSDLSYDGELLEYSITVADMDEITAAHIHGPATPEENAPVILTLFSPSEPTGPVSGELVSGFAGADSPELSSGITLDLVLRLMRNDSAYVQVHSVTYPGGVLRGHVVPE